MEVSFDPAPVAFGATNYPVEVFVDQPVVIGPQTSYIGGNSLETINIQGSAAGIYLIPIY